MTLYHFLHNHCCQIRDFTWKKVVIPDLIITQLSSFGTISRIDLNSIYSLVINEVLARWNRNLYLNCAWCCVTSDLWYNDFGEMHWFSGCNNTMNSNTESILITIFHLCFLCVNLLRRNWLMMQNVSIVSTTTRQHMYLLPVWQWQWLNTKRNKSLMIGQWRNTFCGV